MLTKLHALWLAKDCGLRWWRLYPVGVCGMVSFFYLRGYFETNLHTFAAMSNAAKYFAVKALF